MLLRLTLKDAITGFWDGGAKKIFNFKVDGTPQKDSKGWFVRVGSWDANFWFHVAQGKTEKQTLSYAKTKIRTMMERRGMIPLIDGNSHINENITNNQYKFEYID